VWGVMPLSALAAGWLGTALGTVPALWIGSLGGLVSALPVALGPFWRLRELPAAEAAGGEPATKGPPAGEPAAEAPAPPSPPGA